MDYQLFNDLEREMEERQSLLWFDMQLSDMAPEREAQQILNQIAAEEMEMLDELQKLYYSFMKQNYFCEDRPKPQLVRYEDGLRNRILREIRTEQDYGEQYAKSADATICKAMFLQFSASLQRVQRLTYLLICSEKNSARRTVGV